MMWLEHKFFYSYWQLSNHEAQMNAVNETKKENGLSWKIKFWLLSQNILWFHWFISLIISQKLSFTKIIALLWFCQIEMDAGKWKIKSIFFLFNIFSFLFIVLCCIQNITGEEKIFEIWWIKWQTSEPDQKLITLILLET